jgi:succinate dehydrogenase / fumarate reductase cytochrome b subunit
VRDLLRKYSGQFSGMLAHWIQRVTGLLLLVYLFLHVRTVYALRQGPAAFDRAVGAFNNPFFKLLEIALLGAVVLHALNGIRITLIDLGKGHDRQRRLFWIWSIGVAAVIFLAGAIPMFLFSVLKH